jgi:hypothetical protein
LGFPFLWQPVPGSIAALACDSRLVHRCNGAIIYVVMPPPSLSCGDKPLRFASDE